jgi:hypothetical protein
MVKTICGRCILCVIAIAILSGCAQAYDAEAIHTSLKGYLFINEILTSGSDSSDWIELYNPTNGAMDLSGFYLSDTFVQPLKWAFPEGTVIPAKGYLVVLANGDDEGLEAGFRLGDDEEVILTTPGGTTEIDAVDYLSNDVPEGFSYGRSPDGSEVWMTFPNPTMGRSNSS